MKADDIRAAAEAKTDYQRFSGRAGSLMESTSRTIGTAGEVEVAITYLSDLGKDDLYKGLHLSIEKATEYSTETHVAVLDGDEHDALCRALKIMRESVLTTSREDYTEVYFRARCGFRIGAYWSDGAWHPFAQLEEHESDSYAFMSLQVFQHLAELVNEARAEGMSQSATV